MPGKNKHTSQHQHQHQRPSFHPLLGLLNLPQVTDSGGSQDKNPDCPSPSSLPTWLSQVTRTQFTKSNSPHTVNTLPYQRNKKKDQIKPKTPSITSIKKGVSYNPNTLSSPRFRFPSRQTKKKVTKLIMYLFPRKEKPQPPRQCTHHLSIPSFRQIPPCTSREIPWFYKSPVLLRARLFPLPFLYRK